MSVILYWLLFALAATMLVAVPFAARWERRQDDRERAYLDRQARLARTEQARRRIRMRI